jgi:hypothetical protein
MATLALLRYAVTQLRIADLGSARRVSPDAAHPAETYSPQSSGHNALAKCYHHAGGMIRWLLFQSSIYWSSENVSSTPGQFLHTSRASTQFASNSDFAKSREKVTVAGEDDINRRHRSVSSWLSSTECSLRIRIARGSLIFHLILCTRGITSSKAR